MLHEPAAQSGPDASADYKMRVGVWMFLLYAAVYAAFVAINLLRPLWMEKPMLLGLNLAVVYGFGRAYRLRPRARAYLQLYVRFARSRLQGRRRRQITWL